MKIKNNLKKIRMKEYAEEPAEFAERLDVNLKTYYSWESGRSIPSGRKMFDISEKLNKKIQDIWWSE